MKITFLREMAGFVVLVLLQTLVLNRISVFGVAVPILYIYFLIKLPKNRNLFYVVISGFLMGLIIDIFLNTPGMNAAATTIVATLRKPLMNIFFSKVEYEDFVPSIYTETGAFLRYSVVMVLLHQTLLFFIESFTFFNLTSTLIRIGASSVLTLILIIALDGLMYRKTSGV
ncbi:MAG: rod shape-determining protein MreD [Dysgonamonadaceae bacterium]|jgi:rod shape-determining protein MreD